MIEFTENAASTRYAIFVNQNCSDHSGAVQRTRAKRCLLAAGPLTRLTGFVQHELYRRPASMLAHFCCFSSILRARPGRRLRADRPRRRWREGNWPWSTNFTVKGRARDGALAAGRASAVIAAD